VKTNLMKIFVIATLMVFISTGVLLADGWRGDGGRGRYAYGHYKPGAYPHYRYYAPRPYPVVRYYRPVVVNPYVYYPPVVYAAPAPSEYYYGPPPAIQPWIDFSVSVRGH
jgi:hypothetical protein